MSVSAPLRAGDSPHYLLTHRVVGTVAVSQPVREAWVLAASTSRNAFSRAPAELALDGISFQDRAAPLIYDIPLPLPPIPPMLGNTDFLEKNEYKWLKNIWKGLWADSALVAVILEERQGCHGQQWMRLRALIPPSLSPLQMNSRRCKNLLDCTRVHKMTQNQKIRTTMRLKQTLTSSRRILIYLWGLNWLNLNTFMQHLCR